MLTTSGVAQRTLSALRIFHGRATNWKYMSFDLTECNFGVSRKSIDRLHPDDVKTRIEIEFPCPDPDVREKQPRWSESFTVQPYSFGWVEDSHPHAGPNGVKEGPKLTEDQLKAVEEALKLQEAETVSPNQ